MHLQRSILILLVILTSGLLWSQVNPPSNLAYALDNGNDIQLIWEAPAVGEWVSWCGDYTDAIGTGGAFNFEIAARFDVTDLAPYAGGMLTMVSFIPAETSTYTIKIYTGGSQTGTTATPGTVQRTQAVPNYTQDEWNTITLNTPLDINTAQEMWVAIGINTLTGHPAGCDGGPSIPWKGDMIKSNNVWKRLSILAPTLDYNFCIKGFIQMPGRNGQLVEVNLTPEEYAPIQAGNISSVSHYAVPFPDYATRALLGYNLFRNGAQVNSELITDTFYIDSDLNTGLYDYYVVAVWDEGTSVPSNTIQGVVPLADNSNNTPQTASTLTLNLESTPYMIETVGDEDWYKFQITSGADLYAYTELVGGSALDTKFQLYGPANENGSNVVPTTFVASDDNSHGQNQPELLYPVGQTGWYFLRVAFSGDNPSRDNTGFYTLVVRALGGVTHFPPSNLTASVTDFVNVNLHWNTPAGQSNLLKWDTGENTDGIGLTAANTWSNAIRFDTYDLVAYHGKYLTEVSFFANAEAPFTLKVWQGGSWSGTTGTAGTVIVSQAIPSVTVGAWNDVILATPVAIDATAELWIGMEIIDPGSVFAAGVDGGPGISTKGNLILTGTAWGMLPTATLDYNWNMQGTVADTPGMLALARPLAMHQPNYGLSSTLSANPVKPKRTAASYASYLRNLTGYKLYRDGAVIQQITNPATLTFADNDLPQGNHQYYMTSVYENTTESPISNTVSVLIGQMVLNPPLNLRGTINDLNVILQWDRPATLRPLNLTGWKVYRDGVLLVTQTNPNVRFYNCQNNTPGVHEFHVTAIYNSEFESGPSNIFVATPNDDELLVPLVTSLKDASPNPFNPVTSISYSVKERQIVHLNVFNVRGQKVCTLVNAEKAAGTHTITWNGRDSEGKSLSSGIYFYTMSSGNFTSTKKLILLK